MAKKWLKAADENGIPTAFVVHDGKIAWIGHPMELEKPLQKILDGKWDIAESAKKRLAEKSTEREESKIREKLQALEQARTTKGWWL